MNEKKASAILNNDFSLCVLYFVNMCWDWVGLSLLCSKISILFCWIVAWKRSKLRVFWRAGECRVITRTGQSAASLELHRTNRHARRINEHSILPPHGHTPSSRTRGDTLRDYRLLILTHTRDH